LHFSTIFYEFSKFNSKRKYTFAERSLEGFESFQTGPWPESKGEEGFDRPSPAALVTGGEG